MKSTLPVIPDSYIPLSSHNHEITQARRYGMDAYTASDMDIRAVDPAALVDIRDVKVNTALPKRERILDFIRQIGNPYCYRHGKYVVRVSFTDTDISLEDRLEAYIRTRADPATSSTVMRIAGTILEERSWQYAKQHRNESLERHALPPTVER